MSSHYPLIRRAVASLIPLAFASHAFGACTVPQGTLTNLDAGVAATCDGPTDGVVLSSVNDNVQVVVNSDILSNSTIDLAGAGSHVSVLPGGSVANGAVTVRGATGSIVFYAGSGSALVPGTVVMGGVGKPTAGTIAVEGNLSALGVMPGAFMVTGLDGNQSVRVRGTLSNSTGLFISTGNGNDDIEIFDTAILQGGTSSSRLIDGGAGVDTLLYTALNGAGAPLDVNSTSVEVLSVDGGLTLGGTHEFADVLVNNNGTLAVSRIASLGNAGADISVATGGRLTLDLSNNGPTDVTHSLAGNGIVELTGLGRATLSGDNSGFSGTLIAAASSNGVGISGAGQIGTATLQVDGQARFVGAADFLFDNAIRGAGGIFVDGTGTVTLGTNNDPFTGVLQINGGTLVVAGSQSSGSGEIVIETAGTLLVDNGAQDSQLLNGLYGSGTLVKRGSGTTTLTGYNPFGGNSRIEQGALRVGFLEDLGVVPANVSAGAALILDYSDPTPLVVTSLITGQGQFIKEGTGLVVVDDANTYTGGTVVRAGRLGLNDGQGLGTGTVQVDSGAILGIGGVLLANAVTGTGQIIKTANNQAALTGNNTGFTGELRVEQGVISVQNVAALGAGIVDLDAGTELRISNATDQVFSTALYGEGDVIKSGAGRLIINGTNAFIGDLNIEGGTLQVDGSGSSGFGNIDLASGTTLNLHAQNGRSFSNTLSGAGQVVKTGAGYISVRNGGQYSGGTSLQEGGLRVTDLADLGTGAITSAAGSTLVLNHSDPATMVVGTIMEGAGTFQKEGTGIVVVNASNTYTGGTLIQEGRLGLNFGDALGTGAIQVASGAILGIGNIALANNVTGTGQIIKTAADVATLGGNNTGFSGELVVQQGTVAVSSTSALGTGAVNVASGATLQVGNTTQAAFTNTLSGAGTLVKQGTGRLDFANPFTIGALNLAAGSVRLNATGTANATVASGAALDGTGRLIGNLVNNGVVAPGNSIGTLTVQGNYVHNAGSVLEVEFDAAGNIDLLDVTGTATLNGGTLRFVSLGGAEGTGGTFLTAGGGLTGTFGTIETAGAQLPLTVIYQGSSALMAPSVVTARPSTFNAQLLAGAETSLGYLERAADAYRWAGADHVWFQAFGARGKRDAAGASLGYQHDSQGFATGVVWPVATNLELGASAGWSTGDIELAAGGGGGEQESLLGSLGLRYAAGRYQLGAGVMFGRIDQETLRNVSFSGLSTTVAGETESKLFGGYVQAGAALGAAGGWTFDASGRASLVRQSQEGYQEGGSSPLRLTVGDLRAYSLELQGLVSASRRIGGDNGVELRFDLGARHLALHGERGIDVAFAASNAGVTLQGDRRDTTTAVLGASITHALTPRLLVSAGYAGKLGSHDQHEARLGLSLGF
jgi:autotransporter-associated beta strand protein